MSSRVLYPNNSYGKPKSVVNDSNIGSIYPGAKVEQRQTQQQRQQHSSMTNRYLPNMETQEMDPVSNGALQFFPAYTKANRNVEASWDVLMDSQDEKKMETEGNLVSSLTARARQTKQRRSGAQSRNVQSEAHSQQSKGRIARLAMLFGNRGLSSKTDETGAASPTNSSSSGYVGWPGTQDAKGRVKSFDESSTEHPSDTGASDIGKNDSQTVSNAVPPRTYAKSDVGQWRMAPSQIAPRNKRTGKQSPVSSTTSSAYMNENELLPFSSFDPYSKRCSFSGFQIEDKLVTDPANFSFESFKDPFERPDVIQTQLQSELLSVHTTAPTKELLEANDRLVPPPRTFQGYPGLIDKAHDVPCLADGIDSDTSSKATSVFSSALRKTTVGSDIESDVFDGISGWDGFDINTESPFFRKQYPTSIAEDVEETNNFSIVILGGGLSAIKTSPEGFFNRKTASDYDDQLTNSECDQDGFVRLPSFHEMLAKGRKVTDSSLHGIQGNFNSTPKTITPTRSTAEISRHLSDEESSLFTDPYEDEMDYLGDLSEYYIPPSDMKKVVRQYRRLSQNFDQDVTLSEDGKRDDENKAFALFEMRSRIMEKDIERGLERRGGTMVVDDIVTTPYYRVGLRVRDACIVSKAWRDGVVPSDVRNAAMLTRRAENTYYIRRPVKDLRYVSSRRYTWEAVNWIDDTDFMQFRCPSLGARNMRGFEMFTIGDCQSILLKLTNEQCEILRKELNEATKRQIEAEDLLHSEGDNMGVDTMTDAEMEYLAAMEDVKTISKKLVLAEQAFALVRDRIQQLVNRYQELLVKIESVSCAGASSIITFESSHYSDYDSQYWEEQNMIEKQKWARRARRAEIRAELAAREALAAKEEARIIEEQKQRELDDLRQKLMELQSDPSSAHFVGGRHSAAVARNLSAHNSNPVQKINQERRGGIDKEKLEGVKQRFRDRIAAKKRNMSSNINGSPTHPKTDIPTNVSPSPTKAKSLFMTAGEEMYSHLDFYERSLRAVDTTRESY